MHEFCPMMPRIALENVNLRRTCNLLTCPDVRRGAASGQRGGGGVRPSTNGIDECTNSPRAIRLFV